MPKLHRVQVRRAIGGDVDVEKQVAWIDFEMNAQTALSVVFPEAHLDRLKVALFQLQSTSMDRRRERDLPELLTSYVARPKSIGFRIDPERKVALLRTRFDTGDFQETVLPAYVLRDTIAFLETALARFEIRDGQRQKPPRKIDIAR